VIIDRGDACHLWTGIDRDWIEEYFCEWDGEIPDCPNCGAKGVLDNNNWRCPDCMLTSPFACNQALALESCVKWIFAPRYELEKLRDRVKGLDDQNTGLHMHWESVCKRLSNSEVWLAIVIVLLLISFVVNIYQWYN